MSAVLDQKPPRAGLIAPVLGAVSFCHLLNDMIQSMLPAVYPILKGGFDLSFAQIGLLTLVYQVTASLLQPLVGAFTDKHPQPYSLSVGMCCSFVGLLIVAFAPNYPVLLLGSACLGTGSSIFHPESSRIARLASGGRHGFAQSVFQVGGNFGTSLGPLLAAFVVLPRGRASLAWFTLAACLGAVILSFLGRWYQRAGHARARPARSAASQGFHPRGHVLRAMVVLVALIFSKFFYIASITSYFIFYLMDRFHISQQEGQVCLFLYLASTAVGLIGGGLLGDKFGRKAVIWGSIVGVLPFTLLLPHVGFEWTVALSVAIGLILSSAFPSMLVYAQELMPGRLGMVSGLFFGLAFGMGGIGAAALGVLADKTSIEFVYSVCSYLPFIGMLAIFLPSAKSHPTNKSAGREPAKAAAPAE